MSVIPINWEYSKLAEVCTLINGRAYKRSELLSKGKYPVLRVGNFFTNPNWFFSDLELDDNKYCDEGDLLYAWSASFGPRIWEGGKVIYHYHIWKVVPHSSDISRDYLHWFFEFDKEKIKSEVGTGSTMIHITKGAMENRRIPVAPYKEQKRIADKIDALMARSSKAKNVLDSIPELLKQYRQSILAAAFKGDLTKSWRADNVPKDSISSQLKKLKKELLQSVGTVPQELKIKDTYDFVEDEKYPIPETWKFVQLKKLASTFSYGSSQKSQKEGNIPVLRMGNIQRGELDWTKLVYSSDVKEIEKYKLQPNDVLFNRTNSPELVGKTAIYRGNHPAIFAGYLIRVRPYEILNPEYLNYCLASQSDGVSQSNINAQKLAAFEVPLCSPNEQIKIVKIIKEHFAKIDVIEQKYIDSYAELNSLNKSILDKAFSGELIIQNLKDETANALLERIKKERAKADNDKKTGEKIVKNRQNNKVKKMVIPVIDALKNAKESLTSQELLKKAGYPLDASIDQVETFFLDIRSALDEKKITRDRVGDEDVFKLVG